MHMQSMYLRRILRVLCKRGSATCGKTWGDYRVETWCMRESILRDGGPDR
jgi:hypothetical protein